MEGFSDYYLDVAGTKIIISPYTITPRQSMALYEETKRLRIKYSDFGKLPPNDDETREAYNERFKKEMQKKAEESKENKEELAKEALDKAYDLPVYKDNLEYLHDCVLAIVHVFSPAMISKVTKEALQDTPIMETNNFVVKIFRQSKVPIEFSLMKVEEDQPQPIY